MFSTRNVSIEHKNQTGTDTGDSTPVYSTYQSADSYRPSSDDSASAIKTVAESAEIARDITNGALSAFVGSGTEIIGEFLFQSMLRVDGHFSGRISSADGTLVVAAGGRVDAKVAVAVAKIRGLVTGDIVATDRVELGPESKMVGNIQAPTLIVEQGAVLDGSCRMTPQEAGSEQEAVSGQKALPVQEVISLQEAVSGQEPVLVQDTRAGQKAAAEQKAEKPPKIERKENVLGTRTRRARAKVATTKAVDDEPAAKAMAG